jgi:hypothetical protein
MVEQIIRAAALVQPLAYPQGALRRLPLHAAEARMIADW